MQKRINIIEENSSIGGWSLAVRDEWSYKIKKVHLWQSEKEEFMKEFGEQIISHNEFMNWWMKKFGQR